MGIGCRPSEFGVHPAENSDVLSVTRCLIPSHQSQPLIEEWLTLRFPVWLRSSTPPSLYTEQVEPVLQSLIPAALETAVEETAAAVEYPSSDGLAMAESGWHAVAMVLAKEALDRCFRERKDLYIGIDLFVYYEKGNNKARLAPDVFVAFDVEAGERDTYKVWEEGKAPDFVLEVRSASTEWRDRDVKPEIYARMGVSEYWRLSPRVHHLESSLEGYRLQGGRYQRLERVKLEEAGEWYWSEALGLHLRAKWSENVTVAAFRDPATGQEVLTAADMDRALVKAQERVLEEERAKLEAQTRARQADERARQEAELRQQADERVRQEAELRQQADERVRRLEERLAAELERKHEETNAPTK